MFCKSIIQALVMVLIGGSVAMESSAQKKANFSYAAIPSKYVSRGEVKINASLNKKEAGYDLTELLPTGYVKNGTVDYTDLLQKGLDKYRDVVFPDFPVLINEKGLVISSNSTLTFRAGSKLLLRPNSMGTYDMLRMHNVKNVEIFNPVVVGDRKAHSGQDGQWGMGIAIRSSQNVKIYNPVVSECWGDGIYIGQLKYIPSGNIEIYNAILDFNRRNGISITSAYNVKISNPLISNTFGQDPMSGICVEPNSPNDTINNLLIDNPVTFNNANCGIVIGLNKLVGKSPKSVNIQIKNHIDEISETGFYMGGVDNYRNKPGSLLQGKVDIINPVWINNRRALKTTNSFGRAPKVLINNMKVISSSATYVNQLRKSYQNNQDIIIQ